MNKDTQDAVAWVIVACLTIPLSFVAGVYVLSMSWLGWGLLGTIPAGIALAIVFSGPYSVYAAVQRWNGKEVTAA